MTTSGARSPSPSGWERGSGGEGSSAWFSAPPAEPPRGWLPFLTPPAPTTSAPTRFTIAQPGAAVSRTRPIPRPAEAGERCSVSLLGVLLGGGPVPPAWTPQEREDLAEPDAVAATTEVSAGVPLARRLAWVLQPSLDLLLQHDGPVEWPAPLLPYQLQGVAALHSRHALLLADDMGLGKTIQALAALRLLVLQRRVASALIVVPAGLIAQWREELRRWAPEPRLSVVYGTAAERGWQWRAPAHVYLTSYESLRSDAGTGHHSPASRDWDLVVLDEAQKIKNADAGISRLCKRLRRTRQWALTGTPLENSPDDLLSILDFVDPQGRRERRGPLSSTELRLHLARFQLRRRKADVLDQLPPKIVSRVTLQLAPRQRETYDRIERSGVVALREQGPAARVEYVLDLIQRLKAVCNVCPESGESSKLADLRERIETLAGEGHRALIFSQFTNDSYGARAVAQRLGQPALVYTGDLSPARRDETLRRFREDPHYVALILSLRAGGQGLNLQEASYVFHFDRWWNPAVEQQAEARSHRMGQQQPVHVYSYTCAGTIEERIERVLAAKRDLFDALVDDVSLDATTQLTSEDLFGLFEL